MLPSIGRGEELTMGEATTALHLASTWHVLKVSRSDMSERARLETLLSAIPADAAEQLKALTDQVERYRDCNREMSKAYHCELEEAQRLAARVKELETALAAMVDAAEEMSDCERTPSGGFCSPARQRARSLLGEA
ncbi:MAG: hypothetical protein ACYTFI_00890 [Planctomycetota bacterium]|jgi:chromosome segregation ATPase